MSEAELILARNRIKELFPLRNYPWYRLCPSTYRCLTCQCCRSKKEVQVADVSTKKKRVELSMKSRKLAEISNNNLDAYIKMAAALTKKRYRGTDPVKDLAKTYKKQKTAKMSRSAEKQDDAFL